MRVSASASFLCFCFGFFALSFPVLVSGATAVIRPAQFKLEDSATTAATPEETTIIGITATTEEVDTTTDAESPAVDPTEAPEDSGSQASTVSPPKCLVKCRKPTWEEIQQSLHGAPRPQHGRPLGPDWQDVTLQIGPGGQQEAQQPDGESEEAAGAPQQNNQTQVPADQDGDGDLFDGPNGRPFGPFHGRFGGPSPFFGRFRRFGGPFWRRWKRSAAAVAVQSPARLHKLFRKQVAGNKFWICEQTC